jgi:hypothetical protein
MTVGSQLKQTLAGLRSARGTLRLYAVQAKHEQERYVFKEAQETLEEIIGSLEERLGTLELEEPQYRGF